MRRAMRRFFPRVAPLFEQRLRNEALALGDALERGQPMAVVLLAGIRLAAFAHLHDHRRERLRPFLPGEFASLVQCERHREGLGFPGSFEDGGVEFGRKSHLPSPRPSPKGEGDKWGSQQSTYTAEAVVSGPQRSAASKRTV